MSWNLLSTDKPSDQWWLTAPISFIRAQLYLWVNLSRLLPCCRGERPCSTKTSTTTTLLLSIIVLNSVSFSIPFLSFFMFTDTQTNIYTPPPTDVCIWWVGTVSTDAEDWGSWWSGRFAGHGLFYIPLSQSLSPLLKRYNPREWRKGSPQRTSSSGNSSWWPWGRGWSRSSPRWRSPSWSSWPGPPGRWCLRPHWRPARWW